MEVCSLTDTTDLSQRNDHMDKVKLEELRHELLTRMCGELTEDDFDARLKPQVSEEQPEVLTVRFDEIGLDSNDALGEFFFRPLAGSGDLVQHFTAALTLTDGLSGEYLADVYEAVSYINYTLPCGCFAVDHAHRHLSYRLSMPMSVDMDAQELYRQINIISGNAVEIAGNYMDILLGLSRGEFDLKSFTESL